MVALLLLLCVLLYTGRVQGHSVAPERIARVEAVIDPKVHLISSASSPQTYIHGDPRHTDTFVLRFSAFDTLISLQLTPNTDLFHPTAALTILNDDGHGAKEHIRPDDYRIFRGHVLLDDTPVQDSWARITIRHDIEHAYPYPFFEGAFSLNNDIYHIQTQENYHLRKHHHDPFHLSSPLVIYRDSDIDSTTNSVAYSQINSLDIPQFSRRFTDNSNIMCAMEEMSFNRKLAGQLTRSIPSNQSSPGDGIKVIWNKKRSFLEKRGGYDGSLGCPTTRKIAFMGVAADCTYVQAYGSIRSAKMQIITDWNMASAVYERTFNISLGLIYLQMSPHECPRHPKSQMNWNQDCSQFYTINDRLSDFSLWRGQKGEDGAALWHLMTKCSTGVKVGIAWLSQLCETQASQQIEDNGSFDWVSGTGVSSITRDEWKVVAHEVGHGFGAIHDCTAMTCPCTGGCGCCPLSNTTCSAGETYLMNPTSNVSTNDFSPCSISDVCTSFPNIGYCLQSADVLANTAHAMCGNGILEPGEECDPGFSDNACCYANSCKLKPGAACDDYSSQCCLGCAIAPARTECRPAISECDTPEYCSGDSTTCPTDQYDPDGSSCANGTMQCASGVCTSRDAQCMARGLRLNVTEQCSFQHDSCQISCTDPTDPRNCLVLSGMFLDGTECGLAGLCRKGLCLSTGASNTIRAWVAQNKQIAIPVFLFGGLILLALFVWLTWCAARRYRQRRLAHKDKDSRPPSVYSQHSKDIPGANGKTSEDSGHGNRDISGTSAHDMHPSGAAFHLYPVENLVHQDQSLTPADGHFEEAWELQSLSDHNGSHSSSRPSHRYNRSEGSFLPPSMLTEISDISTLPTMAGARSGDLIPATKTTQTAAPLEDGIFAAPRRNYLPSSTVGDSPGPENPFTTSTPASTGTHRRVKSNA